MSMSDLEKRIAQRTIMPNEKKGNLTNSQVLPAIPFWDTVAIPATVLKSKKPRRKTKTTKVAKKKAGAITEKKAKAAEKKAKADEKKRLAAEKKRLAAEKKAKATEKSQRLWKKM